VKRSVVLFVCVCVSRRDTVGGGGGGGGGGPGGEGWASLGFNGENEEALSRRVHAAVRACVHCYC